MIYNALTIAGSDSGGGAGIQADLKSFMAAGVFGMSVITAVTVQNTKGVTGVHEIPLNIIEAQIDAVFSDIQVDAVKTGMLSSPEIVELVADKMNALKVKNLVVDPVMIAKGGSPLLREEAVKNMKEKLIPAASVITPNIPEAEVLIGEKILTENGKKDACKKLIAYGCGAVIVKGGHMQGAISSDLLYDGKEFYEFSTPRIETKNTHGTGCTFASSVAARLAKGLSLVDAVEDAKNYITNAIKRADELNVGEGHGPVYHWL